MMPVINYGRYFTVVELIKLVCSCKDRWCFQRLVRQCSLYAIILIQRNEISVNQDLTVTGLLFFEGSRKLVQAPTVRGRGRSRYCSTVQSKSRQSLDQPVISHHQRPMA